MAVNTPRGHRATYHVRVGTNDGALVSAVVASDEYLLSGLPDLTGWAMDIGAHIGSVAIALALDHPDLQVIAVEAVPENAEMIALNAAENGVADRVHVVSAAAGDCSQETAPVEYRWSSMGSIEESYVDQNRYVGNVWREPNGGAEVVQVPVVTIASLRERFGVEDFRYVKSDCEGCEWRFFAEGAQHIEEICGEWHDRRVADIVALFPGHDVTILEDKGGIGMFRAVRRV